jgi:hypothetical protein
VDALRRLREIPGLGDGGEELKIEEVKAHRWCSREPGAPV